MKSLTFLLMLALVFSISPVLADSAIYKQSVDQPMPAVYDKLRAALESRKLFVVFEPNIGENLARFAERWGEDYNRNKLDGLRSMVFCNAWYANQVSNADPDMLALCPLSLTVIHKAGKTTVLFERPSVVAKGSAAEAVLKEVEGEVISAIEQALR